MADNFNITQGTGTPVAADNVSGVFYQRIKLIDPTALATGPIGVPSNPLATMQMPATLIVSTSGTDGGGLSATLPAVASNFHYISLIEITKLFTATNAASAVPIAVTTTNLPGSLSFTFGRPAGALGVVDRLIHMPECPIKSSAANTATTIVCPAITGLLWRVNVYYYAFQ